MIAGRTLAGWLARADERGAAGRYFEAHEELELAWKDAAGAEKILLQGLIQVAAGLHRLRLHPEKPDGAFYLLDRGIEKIRERRALLDAGSFAAFEAELDRVRQAGAAPDAFRFGLTTAIP